MKNANPKVSVIMPSLNVGKYIREALTSVCNQTLKDIEIICVDAGSTDGTLEIIEEFAKKDSRIKIVHSDVKSYGYQMNLGLGVASGNYIGIVETDDAVSLDMYEQLVAIADSGSLDIVKADYFKFTQNRVVENAMVAHCCSNPKYYNCIIDSRKDTNVARFSIICGNIYRKSFLREFDIKFNETKGASYQDIGFCLLTNFYCRKIQFVDKPYYWYRQDNPNSSINSQSKAFMVCGEFSYVYSKLAEDRDVYGSFCTSYGRDMFYSYLSTLKRVSAEFKRDFIHRFSLDLRQSYNRGEINLKFFGEVHQRAIVDIMSAPDMYLYENYPECRYLFKGDGVPIVVSLTSYPKRIGTVHKVIKNILSQTRPPDKIVVYLAEEEFPAHKIPQELVRLEDEKKIDVRYVENVYSHKKYYSVFKDYPGYAVVLIDDDIEYPVDLISRLELSFKRYPYAISCMRAHTLAMISKDEWEPYVAWMDVPKMVNTPSILVFPTTGGGTIIPPFVLPEETFQKEIFMKVARHQDDLWIKWQSIRGGVPVVYLQGHKGSRDILTPINGTQSEKLCTNNILKGLNDIAWHEIHNLDPLESKILDELIWQNFRYCYPAYKKYNESGNGAINAKKPVAENIADEHRKEKLFRESKIAWLKRKTRGMIQCYYDNGLNYTCRHFIEKVINGIAKKKKNPYGKNPLVSVVIPVYNVRPYLDECLRSVCAQTLREIEIFCVDDGSTDGSLDVLLDYAKRDPRIIVCKQKNLGAGHARNLALKRAKGKYLAILDADDVFDSTMLELAFKKGEKTSADVVIFRHDRYDHLKKKRFNMAHMSKTEDFPNRKTFTFLDMCKHSAKNPFFTIYGWTWDKLFNRKFIEKNGLKFQGTRIFNDMYFTYAAILSAERITFLPSVLMYQRVNRPDSITSKVPMHWPCIIEALGKLKSFCEDKGLFCETLSRVFQAYALHMLLFCVHKISGDEKKVAQIVCARFGLQHLGIDLAHCGIDSMNTEELEEANRLFGSLTMPNMEFANVLHKEKPSCSLSRSKANIFSRTLKCISDNGISYTVRRILFGRQY